MIRMAFVVGIVYTFYRLTINAYHPVRMLQRVSYAALTLFPKAFAAGIITAACLHAAHHDISLTAELAVVIRTVFCQTFQFRHHHTSLQP